MLRTLTVTLSVLLVPDVGFAWGTAAHRIVADVAQSRMSPTAREAARVLLAQEDFTSLADVSTWADDTRVPTTSRWHYVNLGRDCQYRAEEHCPDGQCIVAAIERQSRRLGSRAPEQDRLKALKYLVHLVADIHQPLHAGFAEDRGGNLFQVRWASRGTNLHAVWDSGLIEVRQGGPEALGQEMAALVSHAPAAQSVGQWAEESCRIVNGQDFYPDSRKPGQPYAQRMDSTLLSRLDLAAWRLAQLLDTALSEK